MRTEHRATPKRLCLHSVAAGAFALGLARNALLAFGIVRPAPGPSSCTRITATRCGARTGVAPETVAHSPAIAASEVPATPTGSAAPKASPDTQAAEKRDESVTFPILSQWAQEARSRIPDAERVEATTEDAIERVVARASQRFYSITAEALDTASAAPAWAPVVVSVGLAFSVGLMLAISTATSPPQPAPRTSPSARPTPSAIVLDEQVSPPQVAKRPSVSVPAVRSTQGAPAKSITQGTDLADKLADLAANGLRATADRLPGAERALKAQLPNLENTARWALEVRPENAEAKVKEAAPVVGQAIAKGAEGAARAGFSVGAVALKATAESLPSIGQGLQSAIEEGMPFAQAGLKAVAEQSRQLADSAAKIQLDISTDENTKAVEGLVANAAPKVLRGIASGFDLLANIAPQAEKIVATVADKVLVPTAQIGLRATSELSAYIAESDLPAVPSSSEVISGLKQAGIDVEQAATNVQKFALDAAERVGAGSTRPPAPIPAPVPAPSMTAPPV